MRFVFVQVALPISRPDIPRSTCMVPGGGIAALPVLRPLHPGPEAEAFCVGKLVPSNLC
jgi:hypothetical protein